MKGRFWEGRFKSQALLNEQTLLATMAYVDPNPVRAGVAETQEDSDYTLIQEWINAVPDHDTPAETPFDRTSRTIRDDKRGHIDAHHPRILTARHQWTSVHVYADRLLRQFGTAVGAA